MKRGRKTDLSLYKDKIEYYTTCIFINSTQWDKLMENSYKANGRKIRIMIKKQDPELYKELALNYHNPYECQSRVSSKYYIYVWSATEYFFKRI